MYKILYVIKNKLASGAFNYISQTLTIEASFYWEVKS